MNPNTPKDAKKWLTVKVGRVEFNIVQFILTSVSFGSFMAFQQGWQGGVFSGLLFGFVMTMLASIKPKPQTFETGVSEDIVVNTPKYLAYIMSFGVWLFTTAAMASFLVFPRTQALFFGFTFSAFAMLQLYGVLSSSTQFIVSDTSIARRTRFPFFPKESFYELKNVSSLKITWYQGLKVSFSDGRGLTLFAHNPSLQRLKPFEGKLKNPQLDLLYRLKQELEIRVEAAKSRELSTAIDLRKFEYEPIGFKQVLSIGVVIVAIVISLIGYSRNQALSKIRTSPPQTLKFDDFEQAFFFYKGSEFEILKQDYLSKCQTHADHNCRLASYIEEVGKRINVQLELDARACSEADPQSCYNVLIDQRAKPSDLSKADAVLSKVCHQPTDQNLTCCDCYVQHKNRQPAQM